MKIIGYNGKTIEQLKKRFHCNDCGCDFIAEYNEYININNDYLICCCSNCEHRVKLKNEIVFVEEK